MPVTGCCERSELVAKMASGAITIDGGMLEGGGQILRNAAALSCLLNVPVTVNNIRAGRSKPGLRPQHLSGLTLIKDICSGSLIGGNVGSTEIMFCPKAIQGGDLMADTKTAGSICLLLQAALPCLFFATKPSELKLLGGTNADMAPQIDFFKWVFQPMVERCGIKFNCEIVKRGYFPKGGGIVRVTAEPIKVIQPIELLDLGHVTRITGRAFVAGTLPMKLSHIMSQEARKALLARYKDIPIDIQAVKENPHGAVGNGSGIILMAETSTGCRLAGTALGRRETQAEAVGYEAAEMLLNNLEHGGCVDEHLQDQLIILMALAKGKSSVRTGPITLHTQTAIAVAKLLTPVQFNIKKISETQNIIECDGIGLENKHI